MKRLLLVGGGHAHLFVLEALARTPIADVEVVLVSPTRLAPYSGMMPGVIAGHYRYEQGCVDLEPLARAADVRWTETRAESFDPARRAVVCADGSRIEYDVMSLDTGSTPDCAAVPGVAEHGIPVKPIDPFIARWSGLCRDVGSGRGARITVVGGGAAGVEVIAAMQHRLGDEARFEYTLVTAGGRLLDTLPPRAGQAFESILDSRGVRVVTGARVARVDSGGIVLQNGRSVAADFTVWATGAAAPDWPAASGFAADEQGFLLVDRHLRSLSHPNVFAAGDVATIHGERRPKSGVFAVRAGPPLAANLRAALTGGALREWLPQRRALALLSTGGRHAVGIWGPLVWRGDWVWRWKDRIDRAFIARFCR